MSDDLSFDAVFERSDDVSSVCVIFRIRSKDDQLIQRNAYLESANLNITLFQNIKQSDLNARLKIGKFVDRKDAAIRAWYDSKMNRPFMRIM